MSVYIANGTRQELRFHFRVESTKRRQVVLIPPGNQVELLQGVGGDDVASMVEQLERYGGKPSDQAKRNIHGFTGLLYNLTRPITSDEILLGGEAVLETAQDRSVSQATKAALRSDVVDPQSRKRIAKVSGIEVERTVTENGRVKGTEGMMSVMIDPSAPSRVQLPL